MRGLFFGLLVTSLLFSACSADKTHYVDLDPSPGGTAVTIRMRDHYTGSEADLFELVTIPSGGSLYQTDSEGHKTGFALADPSGTPIVITGLAGSLVFEPAATTTPLVASFTVNAKLSGTLVSVDTVKVLLHSCAVTIPDLNPWGGHVSPPAPTTSTITYNSATQKFDVVIETAYLRDNAVYVIDFANFNPSAGVDDIRDVTTCTNRVDLNSVADADFDSLFLSAPDASFTGALNSAEFLAYPSTGSLWSVTATNCGKLRYTASLSFTQLSACNTRGASPSPAVTVTDGATEIAYAGTLYVNVIQPLDSLNANGGYEKTQFAYPFMFTYTKSINTLSTITSDNDFSIAVNSVTLDSTTGNLAMVITTTYSGTALTFGSVDPPVSGASLSVTRIGSACSVTPCVESWNVVSAAAWDSNDNGDYTFHFTVTASPSTAVWGVIMITQSLNAAQQGAFAFANALAFYATQADFLNGASPLAVGAPRTYSSSEKVYVREEVTVADGDRSKFTLSIVNAWICYTSINGYTITSCTDPFLSANERFQLVTSGAVNTAVFNRFSTAISNWPATSFTDTSKLAAGISFQAQPLAFQSKDYTVHLQVRIDDDGAGRRRTFDRVVRSALGNVGNFTGAFFVDSSAATATSGFLLAIAIVMIVSL